MSERDFSFYKSTLEKGEVSPIVRDALLKLLVNRPENPVKFLCEYFRAVSNPQNRNRISQAVEIILLSSYGKPVFERNALASFEMLSLAKEMSVTGVCGTVFQEFVNELIAAYCASKQVELRSSCLEQLQKKLAVREHEVVNFAIFRSSVFLCLIAVDFASFCEQLFCELDVHKQGKISSKLTESILNELFKGSLEVNAETDTLKLLAVAANFTNKKIAEILEQTVDQHVSTKTVSQNDFVVQATNIFFNQVVAIS